MPTYNCSKCNEEFNDKKEYEMHEKLEPCVIRLYVDKGYYEVFEEVPYFSEPYSFKQNASGDKIQVVKVEEGEKVYQCKFCDNVFSRVDSLSRHTKKFCKIKKELEALKEKNPHLEDEREKPSPEPELLDFDMDDFKNKFDELVQNYIDNRKT